MGQATALTHWPPSPALPTLESSAANAGRGLQPPRGGRVFDLTVRSRSEGRSSNTRVMFAERMTLTLMRTPCANIDRPGLHKALAAAKAARYDLLLVYRLNRLTRRIRDLAVLIEELDKAEVHFRSATEPFETSAPAGRMLVQMLGVFAEFEREVIIDRVRNGMERKAAKCKWTGGPAPYGYQLDRTTDIPVPDPTEAPVVRQIFTAYARTRAGTRAIATALSQRGIRTKAGKPWSGHTIGRILTNRVYLAERVFGDINVPDAHPAILDPDLFDEVQRIMATGARSAPSGPRPTPNSTSPA